MPRTLSDLLERQFDRYPQPFSRVSKRKIILIICTEPFILVKNNSFSEAPWQT